MSQWILWYFLTISMRLFDSAKSNEKNCEHKQKHRVWGGAPTMRVWGHSPSPWKNKNSFILLKKLSNRLRIYFECHWHLVHFTELIRIFITLWHCSFHVLLFFMFIQDISYSIHKSVENNFYFADCCKFFPTVTISLLVPSYWIFIDNNWTCLYELHWSVQMGHCALCWEYRDFSSRCVQ